MATTIIDYGTAGAVEVPGDLEATMACIIRNRGTPTNIVRDPLAHAGALVYEDAECILLREVA